MVVEKFESVFEISLGSIELHSSSIEGLRRSEVVNNVLAMRVHHGSEHLKLALGDLERSEEVDPFHNLITGWGGQ